MPYLSISFERGDGIDPDAVETALFAAGALSVTLTDAGDDPVLEPAPGEIRLWPATRIVALFPAEAAAPELLARIAALARVEIGSLQVATVEDRAWEREWLKDFVPMRFGARLWVAPHHAAVPDEHAVIVRLDPGLAFGTGTHPTTAMCLRWLDAHPPAWLEVIDYGCGSGILALAAARLGAQRVQCFDIDPQALLATAENAAANGVSARIVVHERDAQLEGDAALLLANILAGPLCTLAPRFAQLLRPGGRLVLSGVLEAQAGEVARAHAPWFDIGEYEARDGWAALAGARL